MLSVVPMGAAFLQTWSPGAVEIDDHGTTGYFYAVEPALIAPTGSAGFSDDEWFAEIPLVVGCNRGPLRLRGLVGYGRSLESDDDEISLGGLVEYQVLTKLSLGLEVVNTMPSDDPDRRWKSMVDVGFKDELSSTIEVQGRLGRSARSAGDPHVTQGAIYLEIALCDQHQLVDLRSTSEFLTFLTPSTLLAIRAACALSAAVSTNPLS